MPPRAAIVLQTYSVGHYVYPSETGNKVPPNTTQVQLILNGNTAVPAGAKAEVILWLIWPGNPAWQPAANMVINSSSPAGSTSTVAWEDSTDYKVSLDITGGTITIGADINIT